MSSVFLFALFFPQFKLPLLFFFPLLTAASFSLDFSLLLLNFKRLLRLGTDLRMIELLCDDALHALGIYMLFDRSSHFNGWAEFQRAPIFQQKVVNLVIFWFCSKSNFADFIAAIAFTFIQTDPKGRFK